MDFSQARQHMVDCQLKPNRITSKKLLACFGRVPREIFVDNSHRSFAYADEAVPMGNDREVLSPMVCAHMLQALELEPSDKLLVAASGTGYTAALASLLAKQVYAVEEDAHLYDIARRAFLDMDCANVELTNGKPEKGLKQKGPFHKILINAPAEEVPQELVSQLKKGGKLAVVAKGRDGLMEAKVYTKLENTLFEEVMFETKGTVLANFSKEERFIF